MANPAVVASNARFAVVKASDSCSGVTVPAQGACSVSVTFTPIQGDPLTVNGTLYAGSSSNTYVSGNVDISGTVSTGAGAPAVHLHATNCSNCGNAQVTIGYLNFPSRVIQAGDTVSWRQYQAGSTQGGLGIYLQDTNGNGFNLNWTTTDSGGQTLNNDTVHNVWQTRSLDLSPYAGDTFYNTWLVSDAQSYPGDWDQWFQDLNYTSANGTTNPILGLPSGTGIDNFFSYAGVTNASATIDTTTVPAQ